MCLEQTSYKFTSALGGKYNSFTYSIIVNFGAASMITLSLGTIRENSNGNYNKITKVQPSTKINTYEIFLPVLLHLLCYS
jgi:hypothetical protein